jgi:hypothetical protein
MARSFRQLRILSSLLLATLITLASTAQAQTPARPGNLAPASPARAPAASSSPTVLSIPPLSPGALAAAHATLSQLDPQKVEAILRTQRCYALRRYEFTADPSGALSPRLSGYSTCAPASAGKLKDLGPSEP